MIETTTTITEVLTNEYFSSTARFFNSIGKIVNYFVTFCNSVSDTIVAIFDDSIISNLPPLLVTAIGVTFCFTLYYFLRGSK